MKPLLWSYFVFKCRDDGGQSESELARGLGDLSFLKMAAGSEYYLKFTGLWSIPFDVCEVRPIFRPHGQVAGLD